MNIVVFVDGLGLESARAIGFDTLFDHTSPLRPGIGYTVNITTELFAGRQPDDAGFFNKWGRAPERSPLRGWPGGRRALALLDVWPPADLAVRGVLRRRGADTARIPWRHCATFGKIGHDVLFGPNRPAFLDGGLVLAHPRGLPGPDHDEAVFAQAAKAVADGHDVLVYLTYLDGIGHDTGPADAAYVDRARWYRDTIGRLMERATRGGRDARIIVVSDHSMSPVTRHVRPPAAAFRQVAFVDSVMIRAWGRDADAVVAPLVDAGEGTVLTDADRRRFGVTRPDWGDVIFLLEPGGLFVPDYFTGIYRPANRPALGMHGYHPDHPRTWGIFFSAGVRPPAGDPVSTVAAHAAIAGLLGGDSGC